MDGPAKPQAPVTQTGPVSLKTAAQALAAPAQAQDRADYWAQQFQNQVARGGGAIPLMPAPKPQETYHIQSFSLTLYRRIPGSYTPKGHSEKRVPFGDGTGYIMLEGHEVDVKKINLFLESLEENWEIKLNGQGPPAQNSGGGPSPPKKHRTLG